MIYRLTAPCHFGLEKTLAFEIKRAGGEDVAVKDGRVDFAGDEKVIAKANITCSVAERIGIVLASFTAKTFDDVFEHCKKIPIEQLAGFQTMAFVGLPLKAPLPMEVTVEGMTMVSSLQL